MKAIKELLLDELGPSKMDMIEEYANGHITRLALAGEIGSSYMDLVDVYIELRKEGMKNENSK